MHDKNSRLITKHKPELLAPAGDFASLEAALQSGCDAVYFGLDTLNMRRGAANFRMSDLPEIHRRCRLGNASCYLTLNTVIYPGERETVCQILDGAQSLVDGVICHDLMVISACRQRNIPVHISTQASVSNPDAARLYAELGAVRVVAARECTLTELQTIGAESGLSLEVFVHGAMCVSVSGRCYISDLVCGKSGNRGECTQNCRREYLVTDIEDGHEFVVGNRYIMSAQDLCTLPFIDMLCDAGLDSFKIEGRGRNPEYVRTVVSAYRRAIDAWAANTLTQELKDSLQREVASVYNRGFCSGFFFGRPIGDFVDGSGSRATHKKEYVGLVTNYYRKAKVVEVDVRDRLFDTRTPLLVIGDTTGVVHTTPVEIRQDDRPVARAARGIVTFPINVRVRVGDKVYRLVKRDSEAKETRFQVLANRR
ncbi:MAG: U32 family peptidase [Deltaproteobacteria bacterium]|nr:U32 family peptidase [Deltaproteobacteria bacterium]